MNVTKNIALVLLVTSLGSLQLRGMDGVALETVKDALRKEFNENLSNQGNAFSAAVKAVTDKASDQIHGLGQSFDGLRADTTRNHTAVVEKITFHDVRLGKIEEGLAVLQNAPRPAPRQDLNTPGSKYFAFKCDIGALFKDKRALLNDYTVAHPYKGNAFKLLILAGIIEGADLLQATARSYWSLAACGVTVKQRASDVKSRLLTPKALALANPLNYWNRSATEEQAAQ